MDRTKELINPPATLWDLLADPPAVETEADEHAVAEKLDAQKLSRDEALTGLGQWHQYTQLKLAGLKAEYEPLIDKMQADLDHLERRLDYIKHCIQHILPPSELAALANEQISLAYTKTQSVEVEAPELVPFELCRVKEPEPDKKAIKAELEAGRAVPGCLLATKFHLQVKPGGIRAIENKEKRTKKKIEKILSELEQVGEVGLG